MTKMIGKLKLMGAILLGIFAVSLLLIGCGNTPTPNTSITQTPSSPTPNQNQQSTTPSLSISLDKQQVNPGDSFVVNVVVNTSVASRGAQASLIFDPSAMQCNGVTEGNFYKDWASANGVTTTMFPSEPTIDNAKGVVEVTAVVILGQTEAEQKGGSGGDGAQGQGIVLSYQMTAKPGVNKRASLSLSDAMISDQNGNQINGVVVNNGQVTIGTP